MSNKMKINRRLIKKKKRSINNSTINNRYLVSGEEIEYDNEGNAIIKNSVYNEMELINYFRNNLMKSAGAPLKYFDKPEDDLN